MKIELEHEELCFLEIAYGQVFTLPDCTSSYYMKTPSVGSGDNLFNAVNLEIGTLLYFDYSAVVYPVNAKLVISEVCI